MTNKHLSIFNQYCTVRELNVGSFSRQFEIYFITRGFGQYLASNKEEGREGGCMTQYFLATTLMGERKKENAQADGNVRKKEKHQTTA